MKKTIQSLVGHAVRNDFIWTILQGTVVRFSNHAQWRRELSREKPQAPDTAGDQARILFPDCVVRHGPFRGMKYPHWQSHGSCLVPKLLGSYESELHPVINRICNTRYDQVFDIGCAEGYYAVGLAMRMPSAKIFAFDTSVAALALCSQMAAMNDVADRILNSSFCDADTLRSVSPGSRGLIISDCEGYELNLFSEDVVPCLASHDILIELHDFMNIEISRTIKNRFAATHTGLTILSIDDNLKAHTYDYPELKGMDLPTRRGLLAEWRPCTMEWLFLTPRAAGQTGNAQNAMPA